MATKKSAAARRPAKPARPAAKPPGKRPAPRRTYAANNKTVATDASVAAFLARVDPARRADCDWLVATMSKVSGQPPRLWGTSIVGFGSYHYVYASGREGDMCRIGFSPRKQDLTVYLCGGFEPHRALLARLGKHRSSVSCLYLKRLDDVDRAVLTKLIAAGWADMARRYP